MKSLQQPAPGARDGEWWAAMEKVFGLSRHGAAAPPAIRAGQPADRSDDCSAAGLERADAATADCHHRLRRNRADGAPARLPAPGVSGRRAVRHRREAAGSSRRTSTFRVFETLDAASSRAACPPCSMWRCPGATCCPCFAVCRTAHPSSSRNRWARASTWRATSWGSAATSSHRRDQFPAALQPERARASDLLRSMLGEIVDIEVRLQVRQPWESGRSSKAPRLEVLYHSIHYLDTIRMLAGEPPGVYCRAVGHPRLPDYSDTRSTTILDYGDRLRCSLTLNHTHRYDETHRTSMLKVEGTAGAAICRWASTSTTRRARPTRWRSHRRRLAAGAAARLVVHRSVRRADVEPAAFCRR